MTNEIPTPPRNELAAAGLAGIALIAFLEALFEYVWDGNGIHGTEGALLVVISTVLMAIAAAVIAAKLARGWVRTVLEILIFIDIIGTGLAAYFLQAWILALLDAIVLLVFAVHAARPRRFRSQESAQ